MLLLQYCCSLFIIRGPTTDCTLYKTQGGKGLPLIAVCAYQVVCVLRRRAWGCVSGRNPGDMVRCYFGGIPQVETERLKMNNLQFLF